MADKLRAAVSRALGFVRRQKHNYQIGVVRAASTNFLTGIVSPYTAIYTVGLGADAVQLGSLSSIGSALSSLLAIPIGWLVDRRGVRPFFLIGIAFSAMGALFYAVAHDWRILVVSALFAAMSTRLTGTSCSVICADSVQNRDRATAQNVCGTLAAVAAMVSPLIAAYLVTFFGGMNVEGIRPLFYLQVVGYGLIFVYVAVKLQEPLFKRQVGTSGLRSLAGDFRLLLVGRPILRVWIVIAALNALPMAMF